MELGARIDARDESQQIPRDIAERFGHSAIVEYMEKEAPSITVEARKKYAALGGNEEAMKNVADPIVDAITNTEEENLTRIVQTASKVAAEHPLLPSTATASVAVNKSSFPSLSEQQKQIIVGLAVFLATLGLGVYLGKRGSSSNNHNRS